jgi:hypothetical protein
VYAKRRFIYKGETTVIKDFISVYGQLHKNWSDITVKEGVLEGEKYLLDSQFLNAPKNKIGEPSSVLIHKNCFNKVGYFNEEMKQALDCEFWYRLMPYYDIGFVDEYLSSFRLHNKQASAINKSQKINETNQLYYIFYKKLFKYINIKNKWKLLKLFHPIISSFVTIKQKIKS